MSENTNFVIFTIDDRLRRIIIPDGGDIFGVAGDIEVNQIMFKMPRYYAGFDMAEFVARVNYTNANGETSYYENTELKIYNNDVISFVWVMKADVTAYAGDVKFNVELNKKENGEIARTFNTQSATGHVLEGLSDGSSAPPTMSCIYNEDDDTVEYSFAGNWTEIPPYCFNGNGYLTLPSLPNGITSIGDYAFYYCSKLALTTLPDNLTYIGDYAFSDCYKLASVEIPKNVNNVGNHAFENCQNLTSVVFKGKPSLITSTAFANCNKLIEIKVPWSDGDVKYAPWGATNATITYNYTEN